MENRYFDGPLVFVGAFVRRYDSVLLVKRNNGPVKQKWTLPGAVLKKGESLHEKAAIAVFDETGVIVKPMGVINAYDLEPEEANSHYVYIEVEAELEGGNLEKKEGVEDVAWVSALAMRSMDIDGNALSLFVEAGLIHQ